MLLMMIAILFVVLLCLFTLHVLLHSLQRLVWYVLKKIGPKSLNIVEIFTPNLCLKTGRCNERQILKKLSYILGHLN